MAVGRGRGAALGDDDVDVVDGAAFHHQTREDAAFAGRTDAIQTTSAARRRARGPLDQRLNSDDGHGGFTSNDNDDVEEQQLRRRAPTQPARASPMARARRQPPSIPASPPLPASSSDAASASMELDAFRSRPRVGLDEQEESTITQQRQQRTEEQLRQGEGERRDASPPSTRRKIAPRQRQMRDDVEQEEPVVGRKVAGPAANFDAAETDTAAADIRLVSCGNCGRRFAEERVAKHEKACASQKARKQYDTKKHRVLGQDHATYALDAKYQKEEVKGLNGGLNEFITISGFYHVMERRNNFGKFSGNDFN